MNPFANIMAAVMRGNAEVQAQQEVKREADKQAAGVAKSSLTHNPDGTVTIKNIDPTLLNPEDRTSNLQKAYETPKINVERAISERGFIPKDTNIVAAPEKLDEFSERYRARRQLGGGVIQSALMAGLAGARTDPRLRENLQNANAAQNSATFQKFVKPVMDEEQDEAQLGASAANTRELATSRRSTLIGKVATFAPGSTEEGVVSSLAEQLGGFAAGEEEQARKAFRTNRVSFLDERAQKLSGTEGQTAIEGYGETADETRRFIADNVADPSQLSETEAAKFASIAAGLQKKKRRAEEDQALQRTNAERAERRETRMEQAQIDIQAGRLDERVFRQEMRQEQHVDKLHNAYVNETKGYQTVVRSVETIEEMAKLASGVGDIGMIYGTFKAFDNDSAVREAEAKMGQEFGGALRQMKNSIQRAFNGKLYDDKIRQEILSAARVMKAVAEKQKAKADTHYKGRAKDLKVRPGQIHPDLDETTVRYDATGKRIQ